MVFFLHITCTIQKNVVTLQRISAEKHEFVA